MLIRLLEVAILFAQVVDIGKCVFRSLRAYIIFGDVRLRCLFTYSLLILACV